MRTRMVPFEQPCAPSDNDWCSQQLRSESGQAGAELGGRVVPRGELDRQVHG